MQAATGINLWREWAKIELSVALDQGYQLPAVERHHAGIVVSLSRFQHPDTSSFQDDEIYWRMQKDWHIGLIVRSEQHEKVGALLDQYTQRIGEEFHASLSPPDASRV